MNMVDWSLLPAEIISKIFELAIEKRPCYELNNFGLVCKTWLHSAQLLLYSKIDINTLPQLREFYSSVANNTYLGEAVKKFCLRISTPEKDTSHDQKLIKLEIFQYLTPLLSIYLPNLEILNEFTLYSYTSTLDALLDGKLKKLKILGVPASKCNEKDMTNYITCVLLMKDRLENLFLSDSHLFEEVISAEQLCFRRLYDKLERFNKLRSICITRKNSEAIQALENVIERCKSLEEIGFYPTPVINDYSARWSVTNNNVSVNTISNYVPTTNIKALKVDMILSNDNTLLSYIMHKFSQLPSLSLNMQKSTSSNFHVDHQMMSSLFNYLSQLEAYSVTNIRIDDNTIWNTIENHWNATSEPGSKHVGFNFTYNNLGQGAHTLLDLSKQSDSCITSTTFKIYVSHLSWNVMTNFLNKSGKFIRNMRLDFENVSVALKDSFLPDTFTCCPNLHRLHLNQSRLEKIAHYLKADFSKRMSLDELSLENLDIRHGVLENWSIYLPELKCLRLCKITFQPSENQPSHAIKLPDRPLLEIAMPSTKIGLIVFKQDYLNERISFKVFVMNDGTYYYYLHDPSTKGKVYAMTEAEYTNTTNNSKLMFICCLTKPDLLFEA